MAPLIELTSKLQSVLAPGLYKRSDLKDAINAEYTDGYSWAIEAGVIFLTLACVGLMLIPCFPSGRRAPAQDETPTPARDPPAGGLESSTSPWCDVDTEELLRAAEAHADGDWSPRRREEEKAALATDGGAGLQAPPRALLVHERGAAAPGGTVSSASEGAQAGPPPYGA